MRRLARASSYLPVGPLTAAANVRWGHLQSFRGRPPLTALDLFYQAGGPQPVRGHRHDVLSAYALPLAGGAAPVPAGKTTQGADYVGTPASMAPEHAVNSRPADQRRPLWSLAATLYTQLTAEPPTKHQPNSASAPPCAGLPASASQSSFTTACNL